jgi:hypothetical protein
MLESGDCEREQAVGSLLKKVSQERITILMAGDNSSDLHLAAYLLAEGFKLIPVAIRHQSHHCPVVSLLISSCLI